MKNFLSLLLITCLLLTASSCELIEQIVPRDTHQPKKPDFFRYIAVGNSITAGFTNGGLYREGQQVSYVNLLAGQLQMAGGTFRQPLFSEEQKNGSGYLVLKGFDEAGNAMTERVGTMLAIRGIGQDGSTPLLTAFHEPVDNLGIPGIRVADVRIQGYGFNNPQGFNPFFERLLPQGQEFSSYLQFISGRHHTFFTCWLGNNDLLNYAASGGTIPATPMAIFEVNLSAVLDSLTAHGAQGVVANLAELTSLPYFTTITVEGLMKSAGDAPLWVKTGMGEVRQATKSDLIRLEADSIGMPNMAGIPKGFSAVYPLPDEDVVDEKETIEALALTKEYNQIIKTLAAKRKLALLDANALLKKISVGMVEDGVSVNSNYITGNVFSLDGVHLTAKGNAITANEFIKVINGYYKTSIPRLNTAQYPGLL
jgi:hypothetical protein